MEATDASPRIRESFLVDGPRLRRLRLEKVWSQQDLAERLGVSSRRVSWLESGPSQPTKPKTIRALMEIFECHWDDFAVIGPVGEDTQ